MKRIVLAFLVVLSFTTNWNLAAERVLWQIGQSDHSVSEFALAPNHFADFLERFGSPDRAFYIGLSDAQTDWPYVLPGIVDGWAGSHYGARNFNEWDQENTLPIGFVLKKAGGDGECDLVIDVADSSATLPPRLRVVVNGNIFEQDLKEGGSDKSIHGDLSEAKPQRLDFRFSSGMLRVGYNEISLRVTRGSWLMFDALELDAPKTVQLAKAQQTVIRSVSAPPYAVTANSPSPGTPGEGRGGGTSSAFSVQNSAFNLAPTLTLPGSTLLTAGRSTRGGEKEADSAGSISRLSGATVRIEVYRHADDGDLHVRIGKTEQRLHVQPGLQVVELPTAASGDTKIHISDEKGKMLTEQHLNLQAQPAATPADYVNMFMGTGHARWMISPGAWMPNSMLKLAPDNKIACWCAGYEYTHEYINCFSHIHEFTMAGLGMMPTVGPLRTHPGLDGTGYSSRFDKRDEHAGIGFYDVLLKDSGIRVEQTATTRATLQRYTFPASDEARVLLPLLLPNEYDMHISSARVRRVGNDEIAGDVQTMLVPVYGGNQHFDLHFVCQFSKPFDSFGGWNGLAGENITISRGHLYAGEGMPGLAPPVIYYDVPSLNLSGDCGAFVKFKTKAGEQILVRTGISLVSDENAKLNLEEELAKPFGWDFAKVVQNQRNVWNDLFDRIRIETRDAREKMRFYTNMYRAMCDRNMFSDVDGEWIDPLGRVQKLKDPAAAMMSSDALWNTFWNLNQLMNLVMPEWSVRWTNSELELFDKCGWTSKGPAGLKYVSVMVAEHEIPLMVAAYQAGLPVDGEHILNAAVKMQTTLPQRFDGGQKVGNENLAGYLKYHYVPADGKFKGNTSNTCEYAYDDWTVSQLAKGLGHEDVAKEFGERSGYWRNVFDPSVGYLRPRKASGKWVSPFDPFHTPGYVEGNPWQYTWFVPQDVPGLVKTLRREEFVKRLNEGFEKSAAVRFNAAGGNAAGYYVDQGNEPTMQIGWLFNWAGEPALTQKWVRAILDEYYGYNPADAYLGDEDQGQMSSWFVMASMGLFQTDGGCRVDPIYEIGSPLYPKITMHLSPKYSGGKTFTIEARNVSATNRFIQSATLNGKPLNQWWIRRGDVMAGGDLVLEMGAKPSDWAKGAALPR